MSTKNMILIHHRNNSNPTNLLGNIAHLSGENEENIVQPNLTISRNPQFDNETTPEFMNLDEIQDINSLEESPIINFEPLVNASYNPTNIEKQKSQESQAFMGTLSNSEDNKYSQKKRFKVMKYIKRKLELEYERIFKRKKKFIIKKCFVKMAFKDFYEKYIKTNLSIKEIISDFSIRNRKIFKKINKNIYYPHFEKYIKKKIKDCFEEDNEALI